MELQSPQVSEPDFIKSTSVNVDENVFVTRTINFGNLRKYDQPFKRSPDLDSELSFESLKAIDGNSELLDESPASDIQSENFA